MGRLAAIAFDFTSGMRESTVLWRQREEFSPLWCCISTTCLLSVAPRRWKAQQSQQPSSSSNQVGQQQHGAAKQLDDDLLACTQESEELEVYAACHPRHLGG